MSTFLQVWGAAFLVGVSCWGAGSAVVTSKRPLIEMLCGWCGLLVLCSCPWIAGFSARAAAPLIWVFLAAGLIANLRLRRWPQLAGALFCAGLISLVLCAPCLIYDGTVAYGAHGTDMWGYVCTAEWLNGHSPRELPALGHDPMRFNWTWYVLKISDRPLAYESLACLGSALHLTPLLAYFAFPVALLASLAMALAFEPGVFRIKHWALALGPAVLVVFHPLIVFHWIAGFAGGAIVGLFIALAVAAIAVAEEGRARTEAFALGALMLVLCAALYTPQLMLLGPLIAVPCALPEAILAVRKRGWRQMLSARPGILTVSILLVTVSLACFILNGAPGPLPGTGTVRWSAAVLAQFLGIFGGTSPYAWLYYRAMEPWDSEPWRNPVALSALALMAILFGRVSWRRWQTSRDIRLPVMIVVCVACLLHGGGDPRATLAKAMPVFGFALVYLLAAVSGELESRGLALAAVLVCCQPVVRSASETESMLHPPYIMLNQQTLAEVADGENWLILGKLYLREDRDGFNWPQFPRMYRSITWFLPRQERERLALKYQMPAD